MADDFIQLDREDPRVKPALHLFVTSKTPRWGSDDALPKFDTWLPGIGPGDTARSDEAR